MDLSGYTKREVDSSHWYRRDGTACHVVPYAKGEGYRPTTLRDARKMKLLPSATNILGVIEKGGLRRYIQEQTARAVIANPWDEKEPWDFYFNRIVDLSKEVVTDAANLGTQIHAGIEEHYNTGARDEAVAEYVDPVVKLLADEGAEPEGQEVRVVGPYYAGTADMVGLLDGKPAVIDFKSRKSKKGKFGIYETDRMQLAAYWRAHYKGYSIDEAVIANLYISTSEPGVVQLVRHSDAHDHYLAFEAAALLWRYMKGYDPRC